MYEIARNYGLDEESLRYMAAGVLMRNNLLPRAVALAESQKLNLHDAKKISLQSFYVKTYEIPLELVTKDSEIQTNHLFNSENNKQIIEKNNKKYLRWFVHPLHESDFIQNNYKDYEIKNRFIAKLTSSRSLLIYDPLTHEQWSLKSSLKKAAGPFSNKEYKSKHSEFHFQMSQILAADPFLKDRFFLEESFVGLKSAVFDEGQIVRSLKPYASGETIIALSGLYDQHTAISFSNKNGYNDNWKEFIQDVIMKDLGITTAHLYEKYGLIHNSFHSQNISVRFDKTGKYLGVLIKDPDFDVNIDKYEKVMGKETAAAFTAKSNIRTQNTIILDFSVLNGVKIPTLTNDEFMSFYRNMGIQFTQSFLEKMNHMRNGLLSNEQIRWRAKNETFVEHQGESGKRIAISFTGPDIEKLLDPHSEFDQKPSHTENKKRITEIQIAKEKIMEEIIHGKRELIQYDPLDITLGWESLVHELIHKKENSPITTILQKNDPVTIKQFILTINRNKYLNETNLLEHIFLYYPEVLKKNDFSLIFNSRNNPRLMSLFISIAPVEHVKKLWGWINNNNILEYPTPVLKRFFAKLPNESIQVIQEAMERNENATQAFKNRNLSANYTKVKELLRFREQLSFGHQNSCRQFYRK